MLDIASPDPTYQWAIDHDPDLLVIQLPPLAVTAGGRARDAMRGLFRARGFQPVTDEALARPPAANGCALVRTDADNAALVVQIGPQTGATRIPVPHHDPAWSARVFAAEEVRVLVTEAALDEDGALTATALSSDIAAGGVLVAVVPAGTL